MIGRIRPYHKVSFLFSDLETLTGYLILVFFVVFLFCTCNLKLETNILILWFFQVKRLRGHATTDEG